MKIENNTAAGTQSLLLNTAKKVLKPLVRLLLKHGVGYPMLIEELKVLFVEVADQEFKLPGKSQTDSRITILTGVHRKDVKRIRESDTRTQSSHKANLGAQVVAKWISDARYLDSSNQPRPLPRSSVVDQPVSFDQLVESFSKDIRPKVLLDEWINAGIVSVNEHQMVKLNAVLCSVVPVPQVDHPVFHRLQHPRRGRPQRGPRRRRDGPRAEEGPAAAGTDRKSVV